MACRNGRASWWPAKGPTASPGGRGLYADRNRSVIHEKVLGQRIGRTASRNLRWVLGRRLSVRIGVHLSATPGEHEPESNERSVTRNVVTRSTAAPNTKRPTSSCSPAPQPYPSSGNSANSVRLGSQEYGLGEPGSWRAELRVSDRVCIWPVGCKLWRNGRFNPTVVTHTGPLTVV